MTPYTIPRFGAGHDEAYPLGDTASASYIRTLAQAGRLLSAAPFLPAASMEILAAAAAKGHCPADTRLLERAVLAKLRQMSREELAALPGISEGLENRLYGASSAYSVCPSSLSSERCDRRGITRALARACPLIAPPVFTILRRDGKWGVLNDRGHHLEFVVFVVGHRDALVEPVFPEPAAPVVLQGDGP